MRRHERREAEAHGDTAEHEVEDMPAAIGLREMGRQAIRPAIRLLKDPDGREDVVRLGATDAVTLPLVVDLRGIIFVGVALRFEAFDPGGGEQQRIFDTGA
jgi:hypothetical protein